MKNIKETIIAVFAVIGFVVIASDFSINNAELDSKGLSLIASRIKMFT